MDVCCPTGLLELNCRHTPALLTSVYRLNFECSQIHQKTLPWLPESAIRKFKIRK